MLIAMTAFLTVAMAAVATADQVVNNLDTSIDAAAETATTTAGTPVTVGFYIQPSNTVPTGDASGCNATGADAATLTITSPAGVTPTTTTLTMIGCGASNAQNATFTAAAAGTYSFTSDKFSLTGGKTGSLWDTSSAAFTLQVNPAPPSDTTPPVVTITIDAGDTVALSGWYNIASSGSDGVLVHVSASDPSGITNITCMDNGTTQVINTASNPTSFTLLDGTHSISCQATDGASPANTGAASGSTTMPVGLQIDQTAPTGVTATPSRATDKNGWYNAPFTVTWNGSDAPSGISSCTQTTYSEPDVDSGSLSGSCSDVAGNTSGSVAFAFMYDNTNPTVSLVTPPNGADFLKDQVVNASYTCNDAISPGSGLDTCVGTVTNGSAIDTSAFGSHNFTVTAEDNAGNTASVTHTYSVTYQFDGFYAPVDNLPTPNKAKAGQTIPFKWNLLDSTGNKIENNTGLFTVGWGAKFSCDASNGDAIETYDTSGMSGLRWDDVAKQYIFTAQSMKSDAGYCRYMIVQVGSDGVKKALVNFTK